MKITLKGTITKVGEIKATEKSEVREIILNKKYHDPETGELKAEDNYPVQIWKDDMPEFAKAYDKSSRMEISGFLNGRLIDKDGKHTCFMNFTGKKFSTY